MDGLTGDISLHNQSVDSSFPANLSMGLQVS